MTETVTINNEELAILCDLMSGWGVKRIGRKSGYRQKTSA